MTTQELHVLVEVNRAIATIRDKPELVRVILERVQPIFRFYDCGLFVFNRDKTTLEDWTVSTPTLSPSEGNRILAEQQMAIIPFRGSVFEQVFTQLRTANRPLFFDYSDPIPGWEDYVQAPVIEQVGYQECLVALLQMGGEEIGIFLINSSERGTFSESRFGFFQEVSHQMAVAVANILANEEILRREQEKTQLLTISEAISKINKRQYLLHVIYQQIQSIFSFDNAGLFITDLEKDLFYEILDSEALPDTLQQQLTDQHLLGPWRLSDSNPNSWWMQEDIVIRDLAEEAQFAKDFLVETQFEAGLAYGLKHMIGGPLFANGKKIGAICFNSTQEQFYTPAHRSMFKSISDQVAVAVANILANEEILKREREKTVLLSLSETIASARNAMELLTVIREKAQQLIPFYDTGILIVEPDGQHHYDLAVNVQGWDNSEANLKLQHEALTSITHPGSVVEYLILEAEAAQGPIIQDFPFLFEHYDHPFFPIVKEIGYQEGLATLLKSGGRVLGLFSLNALTKNHFQSNQYKIFQALADQVAVAVANILANEEILQREREKSLQLRVTNALTTTGRWEDKFVTTATELAQLIPFVHFGIRMQLRTNPLHKFAFVRQQAGMFIPESAIQFVSQLGISLAQYHTLVDEMYPLFGQFGCYTGELFVALCQQYRLMQLVHERYGYRSVLFAPVPLGDRGSLVLIAESDQPEAFTRAHGDLLQRLMPQLSLALENLLVFEDTQAREAEKALQLSLNNALVTLRDSNDLYRTVAEELNRLVPFDTFSVRVFAHRRLLQYAVLRRENGHFVNITEGVKTRYPGIEQTEVAEVAMRGELPPAVLVGEVYETMLGHYEVYRIRQENSGIRSALELPLPVKDDLTALFVLGSKAAYAFTSDDLVRLLLFTPQIALAIDNQVSYEEIVQLRKQLEREKTYLIEEIKTTQNFEEIIGTSPLLQQAFRQVSLVAPADTTVLVLGESGTGKELIARAIHNQSPRRERMLVKLNCAALPAQLIESELFGHEKGAFTGAIDRRIGKFELAQGGTIFLDEVGELPLELQAKLLRVLQEREIERLGGKGTIKTDVRVLAATNRNLETEVAEGRFRLDLYYRLNVFPLLLPPLRDRREDIPLLAGHFAQKFCRKMGKPFRGIRDTAMTELMSYGWPGNIRELENVIEQAVILSDGQRSLTWGRPLVPHSLSEHPAILNGNGHTRPPRPVNGVIPLGSLHDLEQAQEDAQRQHILEVLRRANGRIRGKRGAAELLNLKPTTLESRMVRLGISKQDLFGEE